MEERKELNEEKTNEIEGGEILAMLPSDKRGRVRYRVIGSNGYATNYTYSTREEAEAAARFLGARTDVIYTED